MRTIASAQAEARVGQTESVSTGEKMKFLLPTPGGALEPRTTETPIGTILTIRPLALYEGRIVLDVESASFRVERPPKVDPGSSLPIGPPLISTQTSANGGLSLTPEEPMIVGGLDSSGLHTYTLIRAVVVPNR